MSDEVKTNSEELKQMGGDAATGKKAGPKKAKTKSRAEIKASKVEERGKSLVTDRALQVEGVTTARQRRVSQKAQRRLTEGPVVMPEIATVDAIKQTDLDEDGYSEQEYNQLMLMYEETIQDIREGEIVKGQVMGITKEDVIVDVGFKSEGIISIHEFTEPLNIQVGDGIEVFLDAVEDQNGQLVLSKQKADFMRVWDHIKDAHDSGELVEGKLVRRIKGGIVVDLFGVDAFLPGSQIALRQVPDFDELIGRMMEVKIIKLNKSRRNIVVSRRVVLEEEREKMRASLLNEIAVGQMREGVVKNITDFGVFIDLGGVDGLLHITDMSWGRVAHPSEMVSLGETIEVKILDFDKESGRISLGLKQLTEYPWETIEEKYPVSSVIDGTVVSLTDYGAFVELEKGVEGLIHISEMSWTQHIKHPSKVMQVGDRVKAMVLSVDKENEKISLGVKQMEPDPWTVLDQRYPVGSRVNGKVRNLTTFGAFIELEEGIDGLVHISDMSWNRRIQHPSEVMKRGQDVEVVVLKIDRDNRRISLGFKQLTDDPWPSYAVKYAIGVEVMGSITRVLDRGVIVELGNEVEGFVATNQLGKTDISKPSEAFKEGDELPLKVVEFDQGQRKIALSVEEYYRGRDRTEMEAYVAGHPTETTSVMGDAMDEALKQAPELAAPASTETPATSEAADDERPVELAPPPPVEEVKKEAAPAPEAEAAAEQEATAEPEEDGESTE
jgi:small subunit ribosomal protein S1